MQATTTTIINPSDITNIILMSVTVLGWFATFWFGTRQQRLNTRDQAKLKVYEELSKKQEEFQNASIQLTTKLLGGLPFILIESDRDMPKKLLQIRGVTDQSQLFKAELEGKQKALERSTQYVTEMIETQSVFGDKFIGFWKLFETWSSLTPQLESAMRVLGSEYTTISDRLNKHVTYLITMDKYNSEKWDKIDIESRSRQIWEDVSSISYYMVDFISLIHNELVTPLLRHTKKLRKTKDSKYKVLTKDGLTVRLETDEDIKN